MAEVVPPIPRSIARWPTHGKDVVSRGVVVRTGGRLPTGSNPTQGNRHSVSDTGQRRHLSRRHGRSVCG